MRVERRLRTKFPRMDLTKLFDVSGKVAIVTGGSRGIGEMIAEGLVTNGVRTYITARKAEACDATAARLSEIGECISIPADMSSADGLAAFVTEFTKHEDKLHILVNNAGAAWGAPLGEFPEVGFDKVMNINVKAPYMLTQALLTQLTAAATAEDPGRVIMTGSIDGIRTPIGDNFSYSASKAAIHMLARHMAKFMTDRNITVNCIAVSVPPRTSRAQSSGSPVELAPSSTERPFRSTAASPC